MFPFPSATPAPLPAGLTLRLRTVGTDQADPAGPTSEEVLASLDRTELARAARYATPAHARAFTSGRHLLRVLAAELVGADPHDLVAVFYCPTCSARGPAADHGRPGFSFDGEPLPLSLSLSRSSGFVLVGALDLRRSAPIDHVGRGVAATPAPSSLGVDLEAIDAVRFAGFDDVALSPAERAHIGALRPEDRAREGARLWVRKEAAVKATGVGFSTAGPAAIDVLGNDGIFDLAECDGVALGRSGLVAAVAVQ